MERRPHEQRSRPAAQSYGRQDVDGHGVRHAFIGNFKTMVDDLNPRELLPWCIQCETLSQQEIDEVSAKETRYDKNFHLLCTIYRKANANVGVLIQFREILGNINAESGCLDHIIEGLHCQRPVITSSTECHAGDVGLSHWHALLQTMHSVICSSVDARHILPELISKEVITVTQGGEVYNGITSEQRTTLLLTIVRYCGGAKLRDFFEVLWKSNQIPQTLKVADLFKPTQQCNGRCCEAEAFRKAMGKLVISLREGDVERLVTCLYSDHLITRSIRDELLSPTLYRTEHARVNSVLCHLENIIRECPPIYGKLIEIFTNRLQLSSPATILCECYSSLVLASDDLAPEEKDSSGLKHKNTCSPISKFNQQLMELYKSSNSLHLHGQKWLYINKNRFYINLAIIKKERVTLATADPITRETIEGADLDSILQKKEPVEMQDIFRIDPGSKLQVILVQGAPGVGKSTFALEITKKWSIFKEMRSYHLVLLIELHQPCAHSATNIKDLLQLYVDDPSQIDSVAEFITKQQGEGLLLILDGFDELPAEMTAGSDSVYIRLLRGDYLPKATIVLTTRPSIIGRIEQVCDQRISKNIEILGFLSTDINNFAQEYFKDQDTLKHFLDYIYTHPHIKSMMYIPLNTAIVVELYDSFARPGGHRLPLTLTQLYSELCLYLLECYATTKKITSTAEPQDESFLSRLNCMPDAVQLQLKEIAKVAYKGIAKQTIVYHDLPHNFEHMNFMNKCERFVCFGRRKKSSYNFLHLTLQEYLAAFHISLQPQEEQVKLLQMHHSKPHFCQIWRFLAGLTSFRDIGWDVFADTMGVTRCGTDMRMCSSLLANCLYESQDPSVCSQVYSSGQVVYSPMSVTQYDYYTLGYCISNSPCKWKLCSIGGDGLAMLAAGIKSKLNEPEGTVELIKLSYNGEKIGDLMKLPDCMIKNLTELNLSNCNMKDSACNQLARLLPHLNNLERLDIGDNPFSEGGANSLLCSLSELPKLYYLDLLHAKLSVEDLSALSALIQLIKPDRGLRNLVIGSTAMSLTAKEKMVEVVLRDSNLYSLSIMNLDLAQSGGQLRRKLEENKTLHTLMLWDRSFCIEGCVEVVKALDVNNTLQSLTLMPWYKFHIPESLFKDQSRINWFYYPKQK